jgi:hypothetical protein
MARFGYDPQGMVERRPTLGLLAHVVQVLGVLIVAFPIYLSLRGLHPHSRRGRSEPATCRSSPARTWSRPYRLALFGGELELRQPPCADGADDVGEPRQRARHRHRQDRDLDAVGLRRSSISASRFAASCSG